MTAKPINNFLDYFKTQVFDDKVLLIDDGAEFDVKKIKGLIYSKILKLKDVKANDILLSSENNLHFILNFLACIFLKKNIYLYNDNQKNAPESCFLFDDKTVKYSKNYDFCDIDPSEIMIYFYTSGTTSDSKCIKKSLENLFNESDDLNCEFNFKKDSEFIATTALNHLFGITFYFMLPFNKGYIINTDSINFAQDIKQKDHSVVLVSTPSFLKQLKKYSYKPDFSLDYIICAGSKLDDDVFSYCSTLVKNSVIDIYGSTETGVIAYRTTFDTKELKLFSGIKILKTLSDYTEIKSNYSFLKIEKLEDRIEKVSDGCIKLLGRIGNIVKIQEKRVSLDELKLELEKNEFIKQNYCFKFEDKIACLAVLNRDGLNYFKKEGIVSLTKLLKKSLTDKFEIIPQRWKFINSMPETKTGKIDKKRIQEIFNLNLSLPLILDESRDEESIIYKLYFYRNCNFFKGHFKDFPIVPGVCQLFFAILFSKWAFNINFEGGQLKKIKFSNVIKPDREIDLLLAKTKNGITYSYYQGDTTYSSGLIPYKNIYKEIM